MTKNLFANSMKLFVLGVFCLALGVGHAFAQAQAGTGQISGLVADANGAVVPNATVTLTSKATNASQTATTNEDGFYKFVLLQPGTYVVKASATSFSVQTIEAVVQVGRITDANFTLGASGVSAEVTVTAEGVQSTTSNFDAVQSETAIQNLPINGRRFQDFVTLTPTAQVEGSRGQISLSGQRGINGNINVDGVDYNQPFFGGVRGGERSNSAFTLPQESIREFQVVAAGYSAEFGRSSGGIVNAVTKSGTNNLRGSAFYLLRPKQLARANDFANALKEQRLGALGLDATLAPTQHQYGGSIGGPIVKDKLFYFASAEFQRFRAPRQVLFGSLTSILPGSLDVRDLAVFNFYRSLEVPFEQTNDAIAVFGKVDWNVNDANRLNVRYNISDNKADNAVSTGETALDPTTINSLSTNGTEKNRNNIVVGQFISTISSSMVNEFRAQFAHEKRPRIPNTQIANMNTAIGVYGTRNFLPTTQFDRRIQFADAFTVISGNHTVKFGGEFSNIHADQTFGFNQFGVYSFVGLGGGTTGILDAVSIDPDFGTQLGRFDQTQARYTQQIGNLAAAFTVKELSFFAQDAWRLSPNFSVNFGLRYEKQYNPSAEANNDPVLNLIRTTNFPLLKSNTIDPASIPDSQHEWGPRVGFAWDPKADGRMVVRGFIGQYHARTPLLVLAGPFNNFRNPAGDLSVVLGSPAFVATTPTATTASNFNFATFFANNPNYATITGLTAAGCANAGNIGQATLFNNCAPNTVFRQFAIIGINLNTASLGSLPTLTTAQMQQITTAMLASTTNPPANLGIFNGANFTGITPDFKNPASLQFGGGFEYEIWKGTTVGVDYSQVKTDHLQRNTDINIPSPTGVDATTGRVLVNRSLRPLTNIGTIQLRDSSGRSLYRALTFRINMNKKWMRLNAFYTLSKSKSDDDNERDAGGVLYDNPYDLSTEYYLSRLDRRHQFVANPVFFLPYGFEVASAVRIRSGVPVNSLIGNDANGDGNSNERPIIAPGVELPRNYFYNRPLYDVDLRVQKGFKFGETKRIVFSAEFFNILNRSNIQYNGATVTNYCRNSVEQPGQPAAPALSRCGLDGITNSTFLQVLDQRQIVNSAANPAFGKINLSNNPGSQVFQMQLGARFNF